MKLSRLGACEDWKVVRWCWMQASSHNRKASLMEGSMRGVWALQHQTGTQPFVVECTRARVAIHRVVCWSTWTRANKPSQEHNVSCQPLELWWKWLRCQRYVSDLSNVTPRYLGLEQKGGSRYWTWLSAHVWLPCFWDGRLPTPFL